MKYILIKDNYLSKIHYFITLLLVFWMPLSKKYLPIIILLFIISWLLEGRFINKYKNLKRNKIHLFLIGFFLLHIIGFIYSANTKDAFFDLEVKMSLLFFPLILASSNLFYSVRKKLILLGFIFGCIVASLICIGNAFYNSLFLIDGRIVFNSIPENFWENNFFYTRFSVFLHPSYFSMYLILALVFVYFFIKEKYFANNKFVKIIIWSAIPLFILSIILNSSRAGIVCFIFLGIVILYNFLRNKGLFLKLLLPVVAIIGIALVLINSSRFQSLKNIGTNMDVEVNYTNSSMERLFLWKTSLQVISENILIGVGTGDVKDELVKTYSENNYSFAKDKKYNAHNEFLETFIRLGIIGFIWLIGLFIYPFIKRSYFNKQVFILFLLIVAFNFLFESMLNTLSGVVFFSFFYSFLTIKNTVTKDISD